MEERIISLLKSLEDKRGISEIEKKNSYVPGSNHRNHTHVGNFAKSSFYILKRFFILSLFWSINSIKTKNLHWKSRKMVCYHLKIFEVLYHTCTKCGLIETLLHKSFKSCSYDKNFHQENETLKTIFKLYIYPLNFMNHDLLRRNFGPGNKISKISKIFQVKTTPNCSLCTCVHDSFWKVVRFYRPVF